MLTLLDGFSLYVAHVQNLLFMFYCAFWSPPDVNKCIEEIRLPVCLNTRTTFNEKPSNGQLFRQRKKTLILRVYYVVSNLYTVLIMKI